MRLIVILSLTWLLAGFVQAAKPTGPTVHDLVAVLKSDASQKAKADACRELARVGNSEAVAALAALLPDEKLSHMARYALETIPGSAADKALRNALGKLGGRPLVGVIGSIGVRRDERAVPALTKLLKSDNPEAAQAAARTLGSIGTAAAAKGLNAALTSAPAEEQLAICEGLLRCAEHFSAAGQKSNARKIYDRLRTLPEAQQVRTAAWRGAILAREPDGLALLLEALRSKDYVLFTTAIRTAREIPGTPVTVALARELPQLAPEKQVILLQELGERGDPAAMPALFAAAAHHDPAVVVAALNAMGSLGSQPANRRDELVEPMIPVLTSLSFNFNPEVAQAAQNAFGALPGRAVDDAVLAMLAPENTTAKRLKALELIGRRRMTSAVPQLFELARGPQPEFRAAAIKRLGELANSRDLPELLNLLTAAQNPADIDAAEQALAVVSQRGPDPEGWAKRLAQRWEASSAAQRCALVRVFSAMGGSNALHAVRVAATDPHPEVRTVSLRALGGWADGQGAADLLQLARSADEPAERGLALRCFLDVAAQSDLAETNRLALCRDAAPLAKSADEKKLLLAALGALRSPEALKLIQPLLDEAGLKEEACMAAVSVSEKVLQDRNASGSTSQVIEVLEQVTRLEPKADVRKRAQSLLDKERAKNHST